MGRPSKTDKPAEAIKAAPIVDDLEKVKEEIEQQSKQADEDNLPQAEVYSPDIEKLLRLNSQYEKVYITSDGFVHPEDTIKKLVGNAKLYTNKYYNK